MSYLFRFIIVITALTTFIHFIKNSRQRNAKEEPVKQIAYLRSPETGANEEPVKQIAYLRSPKTGSSTMTCIFRRFALNHNLTVYSPKNLMVDHEKQQSLLAENKRFDIFTTHTVYNHFFFTHIVPHPVIIGLVREPMQQAISRFFYNTYRRKKEKEEIDHDRLDNFIKNIGDNLELLNIQSLFFGITRNMSEHSFRTKEYLNELNKEFLLVLVLERFNESLVLMKRLLKWSFFDILYGKKM